MVWKWSSPILMGVVLLWLSGLVSCAHEQQLTSVTIQPSTETFGDSTTPVSANAGSSVQLRALGTYIHPPVTKDVTAQAIWATNTPGIATVSSSGLLTAAGTACGGALISATVNTNHSTGNIDSSGAIVTGNMTATVVCFTGTGPSLTVDFTGLGTGTVSSAPSGLGCASSCAANFPVGTVVTITAAAATGSTFGGWAGCDSTSGTSCTVAMNNLDHTVTVTFN